MRSGGFFPAAPRPRVVRIADLIPRVRSNRGSTAAGLVSVVSRYSYLNALAGSMAVARLAGM